MDERTDAQLIEDYGAGDKKAFDALVRRYSSRVYGFVIRLTRDPSMTEDIVQEVFVKVWKNLAKYDTSKRFITWIFTIARTTTIDWLRKKKHVLFSTLTTQAAISSDSVQEEFEAQLADTEPLPHELFEHEERRQVVAKLLDTMPHHYRIVVSLRHYDDMTFEEISTVVDKPMNTVKSHYRRAIEFLRKDLPESELGEYITGK